MLQTLDALLASTTEALDSHLSASLKLCAPPPFGAGWREIHVSLHRNHTAPTAPRWCLRLSHGRGWLEEKDLLSASIARGEAAVGPTQEAAPESAAQRDGYSGAIIRPQALRAQSSATSAPPAPSASAASALGGWLSSVLPSRSAAAGAGAKSSSGGASGGNGAVNADGSEGQRWEGSRRAELAEEVRKINLVRFRSGSLPPLAQELAAVALPPNRWGAALPQAPIPALLVQRGSAGMGTGAGVERLAGAVPGAEAGGAEPLRLLYEALDCVICRADAVKPTPTPFLWGSRLALTRRAHACFAAAAGLRVHLAGRLFAPKTFLAFAACALLLLTKRKVPRVLRSYRRNCRRCNFAVPCDFWRTRTGYVPEPGAADATQRRAGVKWRRAAS